MKDNDAKKSSLGRRPLEYIAFWQFLCFVMLVCLIWTAETLDIASSIFGAAGDSANFFRACLFTAGVIVIGFITVGQTYLLERRLIRGFITVCSYCHKVEVENSAWQQIENFVSDRSLAEFTHGVCPKCYEKQVMEMSKDKTLSPSLGTKS